MAYLTQPDYVQYACSCGQLKPITNLYFCRHCLKIRCGFCICHEVDSHYCANCLENMPSSEARLKKNRCSSCFDCPSCFHTLSTRATLAQPRQNTESGDAKVENKQPKKMYYLSCFNCRWTSRDVGIPDQPVASGGWPERPNPDLHRVNQLLDYYKMLAQQEKQEKLEKERKKFAIRGKYITLTDKTGLTGAMARSIAGLGAGEAAATFTPSQPTEDVPELPDDYYTQELDLNQITSLAQRLACPGRQPTLVSRLAPLPRLLSVKRSQRCRRCDHNLTKPEYNPGSVKFKIELLAYYHVPELKVISYEPVKLGSSFSVLLKLSNPTGHEMELTMLPPEDVPDDDELDKTLDKSLTLEKSCGPAASVVLRPAGGPLRLGARDDAAEYDDEPPQQHSDVIVWRKCNKVCVRVQAEVIGPTEITEGEGETPAAGDPVGPESPATFPTVGSPARAAIGLRYTYRNTVPSDKPNHTLHAICWIDFGVIG